MCVCVCVCECVSEHEARRRWCRLPAEVSVVVDVENPWVTVTWLSGTCMRVFIPDDYRASEQRVDVAIVHVAAEDGAAPSQRARRVCATLHTSIAATITALCTDTA